MIDFRDENHKLDKRQTVGREASNILFAKIEKIFKAEKEKGWKIDAQFWLRVGFYKKNN